MHDHPLFLLYFISQSFYFMIQIKILAFYYLKSVNIRPPFYIGARNVLKRDFFTKGIFNKIKVN